MKSNRNLIESNKEMDEANKLQKKSKRKYLLCALLLIILIAGGVGAYLFTRWDSFNFLFLDDLIIY